VGADLAINVVLAWSTTAEIARNITGSAVTITAASTMTSTAEAEASAKGSSDSDDNADKKANDQVNSNPNTNTKGVGTLPSADSKVGSANSTSSSKSGGESKDGGGVSRRCGRRRVVTTNTAGSATPPNVTATGGVLRSAPEHVGRHREGHWRRDRRSTNIGAGVGPTSRTVEHCLGRVGRTGQQSRPSRRSDPRRQQPQRLRVTGAPLPAARTKARVSPGQWASP
jgi:hypothetical protein